MTAKRENAGILWEIRDDVARLTLHRPPLNILDIATMKEIHSALGDLDSRQQVKLLIIDHEGKYFSAGVDIKDHTEDRVQEMIAVFHGIFRKLDSLGLPTLAVIDGAALGGGCELAAFCDFVIASQRSSFGQPEIKVGVFPPLAAVVFPHLVSRNRTLELLLTGDVISADDAERFGLINRVFPTDGFRQNVEEFVGRITAQSAPVLRLTRKAVDRALYTTVDEGISRVEKIYLEELMRTEDAREGLTAFMEKRSPSWKNR